MSKIGARIIFPGLLIAAVLAFPVFAAQPENPLGVLEFLYWNHPWNNYQYPDEESVKKSVQLMREAGVGIVRMDFLWGDIEPRYGERNFEKYDFIVDTLTAAGIEVLGVLSYHTDWASPQCAWNCPNADTRYFVDYCRMVAEHFKDRVHYWEIWNEPDSTVYWQPQDGLKQYTVLLRDSYQALKQVDPGCKVLNGGLANGLVSVNKLYDNGAQEYFDIFNIHAFETPVAPGAINRVVSYVKTVRKIMARNGDANKPLWITEIGCPGVRRGLRVDNWWMGENPTEAKQASWVHDVVTVLPKQPGVEKVFWAFFRDTDQHWKNGTDYFGLIRNNFNKKPAFRKFKDR